jgi:uncharacterized membrane protein YkoI
MKWAWAAVVVLAGCMTLCAGITPTFAGWFDRSASSLVADAFPAQDYPELLKDSKISLVEGIALGLKEAREGVVWKAELEGDKEVHWAIDVAQGAKVFAVDIDVKTGKVVGTDTENADQSRLAKAARIPLARAIEVALKKSPGQAVAAEFKLAGEKAQASVKILIKGKVKAVTVDAETGEIAGKKASKKAPEVEKAFTDSFPVEEGEWASTGRNTFFILEPGYFQVLEGREDGKDLRVTITVLEETRKLAGVETRVVEEKKWENGVIEEIARDYFAFSKKTGNVYYFGEEVDNYKDGKVQDHAGSWLAGEKDARFGLMMPGTPLLGGRYCQEIAPGVGMDRIEVLSLGEKVETPAGTFERCLKTEDTTPLEPALKEVKFYAPGVGLVQDGDAKLVKYGFVKK